MTSKDQGISCSVLAGVIGGFLFVVWRCMPVRWQLLGRFIWGKNNKHNIELNEISEEKMMAITSNFPQDLAGQNTGLELEVPKFSLLREGHGLKYQLVIAAHVGVVEGL